MKKTIILLVTIVIVFMIFFIFYRYLYKQGTDNVNISGSLEITQVDLAFRVSGVIDKINFYEGQKVKVNDILASIDNTTYKYQLDLANANEKATEWGLKDLEAGLKKSGMSKKELVEQTKAQLEAVKINKQLAEEQLSYTNLKSTLNGIVLNNYRQKGEVVQAGAPVISVGDPSKIWLRAYIPVKKLGKLKIGQKMQVKVDGISDKVFNGTLSYIAEEAEFTPKQIQTAEEREKLVYRVKIDIDNTEGLLKPGIPANALLGE